MKSLSIFENWYGRDEPPPEIIKLKAGHLDLEYQEGDLRYICCVGREIIRRIYVAVRDVNWNTIPGRISNLSINSKEDQFTIQYDVLHKDDSTDYGWHASILGTPDGKIEYCMAGTANKDFRYCRIGFCILHPIKGIAGGGYRAITPTGRVSGNIPVHIAPQTIKDGFEIPIIPACSSLTIDLQEGLKITTDFEGDLFEMEDQRNWTDGSFKTYCTPLHLGYPHTAKLNQTFYQKVTVKTNEYKTPGVMKVKKDAPVVQLIVGEEIGQQLPKIGFSLAKVGVTNRELDLISNLHPDHLKVELHFNDQNWLEYLERAFKVSNQIGCPLEVALFMDNDPAIDLATLKSRFSNGKIVRLIVFNEDEAANGTTSTRWMQQVRNSLSEVISETRLVGGTNGNFAELNRQPPDISVMDGVSFTINPQVHLTDERSLIEALEAQEDTVLTARTYCGTLPISISSVTLKPPFNQAATVKESSPDPRELPASVDQRQMSLFSAAWTVGSLRSLTQGGAHSITYYETTGWRGLMEAIEGNPLPKKFHSMPGMLYPLYYIFEFLAKMKQASFYPLNISRPELVQAMGIKKDNSFRFLVSNLQTNQQEIVLSPLLGGECKIRRLYDRTMSLASTNPDLFLESSEPKKIEAGHMTCRLEPYETIFAEINT